MVVLFERKEVRTVLFEPNDTFGGLVLVDSRERNLSRIVTLMTGEDSGEFEVESFIEDFAFAEV